MAIHYLATTDPDPYGLYKKVLTTAAAGQACESNLRCYHNDMISTGYSFDTQPIMSLWFPDPHEAGFFRDQTQDGDLITYGKVGTLFRKHIQLVKVSLWFPIPTLDILCLNN